MMTHIRKVFALLLSLIMLLSLFPVSALAADEAGAAEERETSATAGQIEEAEAEPEIPDETEEPDAAPPVPAPMPDEPQDSQHYFTVQPAGGSYDPSTLMYHCTWKTSFEPVVIGIRTYSNYSWSTTGLITNDLAPSMGHDFQAYKGGGTYQIRAYFGTGDDDYIDSAAFTVSDDSLTFTVQPTGGSYDPSTLKYHCTWETSFEPVIIGILSYSNYSWSTTGSITNDLAPSMSHDFQAYKGGRTYQIRAYFGTGDDDYIDSAAFTVSDESLTFTVQPTGGSYDPSTLKYHCTWKTSFEPVIIGILSYSNYSWSTTGLITNDLAPSMSHDFPVQSGVQTYRIRAYFGTGDDDYIDSAAFTVSDESLTFTVQPTDGSYDPSTLKYHCTWETSFEPVIIGILSYSNYSWSTTGLITNDLAPSMSHDFPVQSGVQTYRIRAYFGTGDDDYIDSVSFAVRNDLDYGECGIDGDNLMWSYDHESHKLTILGTGQMAGYWRDLFPWTTWRDQIQAVVIKEGVEDVSAYAFENCSSLTSVSLPSTLTSIEDYAFDSCPALADANINMSQAEFTANVSWDKTKNTGLKNAAKHFTFIAEGQAGPSLTWKLSNEGQLSFSGSGAMYNWTSSEPAPWYSYRSSITSLRLANVTTVGDYAFRGCSKLAAVTFPTDLTYLGVRAFGSCSGLTTVYWSASSYTNVTEIPEACFSGCTALQSFTVPKKCSVIGQGAFSGCDALTTVSFLSGSALTTVGKRAFYSCDNLANIALPEGVTSLGDEAFFHCRSLTSLPLPSTLSSLGAYCFSGCSGVTGTVTIPAGVSVIPERCFLGCSGIYEVALTPAVTQIDVYAFSGCTALAKVNYDGFRVQWESVTVKGGNDKLTNASFSWLYRYGKISDTEIYWQLFGSNGRLRIYGTGDMKDYPERPENAPWYQYRNYIETLDVQTGVTKIGVNAFRMTKALTTVYLPPSLKTVGSGAFNESSALTDVWYGGSRVMWGNVTVETYNNYLNRATFHYVDISGTVYGPEGGTDLSWSLDDNGVLRIYWDEDSMDMGEMEIPDYRDYRDTPWYQYGDGNGQIMDMIKAVRVDEYVERIGDYAFSGLNELTEAEISSTVTSIGEGAFTGCRNLGSIEIPDTVQTLGSSVFWGCSSLEYVSLPAGLTEIPYGCFYGCSSLWWKVEIPGTVTSIGRNAFSGCDDLATYGHVYFDGTSAQWKAITIATGNDALETVTMHFNPPEIAVNAANFPDDAFRAYVKTNFDTDSSGYLTVEERQDVVSVYCPDLGIESLTGIGFFPNITYLDASGNNISGSLDLTGNPKLVSVNLSRNQLNSLDLAGLTALMTLICSGNDVGMSAPDLSTNLALEYLDCSNCDGMEGLDLSANTALTDLICSWNQLDTLDLSANTALQRLDCSHNSIAALDLSGCTDLRQADCNANVLTTLTLGQQANLITLSCYRNSLSRLDLTGCPKLRAAVVDGTRTEKTDPNANNYTFVEYRNGADYVQVDQSSGLLLGHYVLSGFEASATGMSYYSALNAYWLDGRVQTPVWKNGNAPGFAAVSSYNITVGRNEACTEKVTAEPAPGEICYVRYSIFLSDLGKENVDFSELTAPACTLNLTGYSSECIRVTTGVSSSAYDTATILFRITKDSPDGIPIDAEHFPDDAFRAYVAETFDGDSNGFLSDDEIAAATVIEVSGKGITTLAGIEYFTALTSLECDYNELTALDLRANTALKWITADMNPLTALDLSGLTLLSYLSVCETYTLPALDLRSNTALTSLYCGGNRLTALDLGANTALENLDCGDNELSVLDLGALTQLTSLYCGCNLLTELDLSHNTALTLLTCESNALTELDVGALTQLTSLYCGSNQLSSLDVSHNTLLTRMGCEDNALTQLDLSGLTALKNLNCWANSFTKLDISPCPELLNVYLNGKRTEYADYVSYWIFGSGNALNVDPDVTLITEPRLPGDCNDDGVVDGADLIRLRKVLAGTDDPISLSNADCNGDGVVDGRDLIRLRRFFAEEPGVVLE